MSPLLRRWLPWAPLAAAACWVAATLAPEGTAGSFDLAALGRVPVLADGRVKPLDTVARTSLLLLQGRQRLEAGSGEIPPMGWLLDVLFRPGIADGYASFRIDDADLLTVFGLSTADGAGGVRFSYDQLRSGLPELDRQARLAGETDASGRSVFQRAVVALANRVDLYDHLKYGLSPPGEARILELMATQPERARIAFGAMDTQSPIRVIPPGPDEPADGWKTAGRGFLEGPAVGVLDPALMAYARIGAAWRAVDPATFNAAVDDLGAGLAQRAPGPVSRARWEAVFNRAAPFYTSLVLYVAAFFLGAVSWLRWRGQLGRTAFHLMALAFALATVGIAARMWLEGRPPVTNLYSSALFISWGAAGICLILERMHRNAIASVAGSLIGFATLVIAHNLSLSGDTMEMMRAVLDSNFWLATHVVAVTTGYAATFLAGFLATIYILRGALTRSLDTASAESLGRMVYGVTCFALFFSFVGTVLGGIWADQSWGRFWGWDPKENGALLIVIWNAVILHARWGGLVRTRGIMGMAVFGNVVTAWSWFGVNMLGVGLHSYGFTDAAFRGLIVFVASQAVVMAVSAIPAARRHCL